MRRLVVGLGLAGALGLLAGCSNSAPSSEPPPKGKEPEVKQATPDMKSPEERGRMQGGGGEGS